MAQFLANAAASAMFPLGGAQVSNSTSTTAVVNPRARAFATNSASNPSMVNLFANSNQNVQSLDLQPSPTYEKTKFSSMQVNSKSSTATRKMRKLSYDDNDGKKDDAFTRRSLLEGEFVQMKIEPVSLFDATDSNAKTTQGSLNVTNYRLHFVGKLCKSVSEIHAVSVPIASIQSVKRDAKVNSHHKLVVKSRLVHCVYLIFSLDQTTECNFLLSFLLQSIQLDYVENLFAFSYRSKSRQLLDSDVIMEFNEWRRYNPIKEFTRMEIVNDKNWTILNNIDFKICETYPNLIVVPSQLNPVEIADVGNYRSKQRVPAVTWKNPRTGVVIARSSQPIVGYIGTKSCDSDEKMLSQLHPTSEWLYIIDPRPKANAVGNQLSGEGGYEKHYSDCKVQFMDIENIHEMRESFKKIYKMVRSYCENPHEFNWLLNLEATQWLKHVGLLLAGASEMADILERKKCSVLVHCSDGWDRTSQLVSLCELMVDPYYRTIEGFIVLIEKDWASFGHQFALRTYGWSKTGPIPSQISPIFLQFIDCVLQLKHQFPLSFEFNNHFLFFILESVYDGRYGNFLYNCERERVKNVVNMRTDSIWSVVEAKKSDFVDVCYRANNKAIYPTVHVRKLMFHEFMYLRHDSHTHSQESVESFVFSLILANEELNKKLLAVQHQKRELKKSASMMIMKYTNTQGVSQMKAIIEVRAIIDHIIDRVFIKVTEKKSRPSFFLLFMYFLIPRSAMSSPLSRTISFRLPKWMPDGSYSECHACKGAFSFFRRKHHCRYCGEIYCDACSSKRRPIPQFNFFEPVRVCTNCDSILAAENNLVTTKKFEVSRNLLQSPAVAPGQLSKSRSLITTSSSSNSLRKDKEIK